MKQLILVSFDSIDTASNAISAIKSKFDNIISVKMTYQKQKGKDDIPAVFSNIPFSNFTQNPSPSPTPVPFFPNNSIDTSPISPQKVIVEIKTKNEKSDEIKNNLHFFGGYNIDEMTCIR